MSTAHDGAAAPDAPMMAAEYVLIAEDERSITALVAVVVAEAGYTPLVARHGQQAREQARDQRPAW